jgi:hypothetical protein
LYIFLQAARLNAEVDSLRAALDAKQKEAAAMKKELAWYNIHRLYYTRPAPSGLV